MISLSELSKREQEYLETIYILLKKKNIVRVKDIANMLKVKPSSVVEFLDKLSRKGLVHYVKRELIQLTENGLRIAEELYKRHLALKEFLMLVLNLPEEIAEKDACYIEHGIHEETLSRIMKFVELIKSCPVGSPKFLENLQHYYREGKCPVTCKCCN